MQTKCISGPVSQKKFNLEICGMRTKDWQRSVWRKHQQSAGSNGPVEMLVTKSG